MEKGEERSGRIGGSDKVAVVESGDDLRLFQKITHPERNLRVQWKIKSSADKIISTQKVIKFQYQTIVAYLSGLWDNLEMMSSNDQ